MLGAKEEAEDQERWSYNLSQERQEEIQAIYNKFMYLLTSSIVNNNDDNDDDNNNNINNNNNNNNNNNRGTVPIVRSTWTQSRRLKSHFI